MDIGNLIRIGRAKKGWSQDDLADKLGVHKQSVFRWESGKAVPDGNTLIQITNLLNLYGDLFNPPLPPSSEYVRRDEINQILTRLDRIEKHLVT
jgi:transcriptional regulator with XRE-family HTH domain